MKTVRGMFAAILMALASAAFAADTMVPAYFYPGSVWEKMTSTAPIVRTVAIVNPNSGPGTSQDPNYTAAIEKFRAAGGIAIGYVSSSYTNRQLSDVTFDIHRYLSFYPMLDGFFIDEMTGDGQTSRVQYYQAVYNYIKGLNSALLVVGNPGTNPAEIYASLPVADTLVVFENYASQFPGYAPANWMTRYTPDRFAFLLHAASEAQMREAKAKADQFGVRYLYATPDALPNPWDTLPSYWDSEVATLTGTTPPPTNCNKQKCK